MIKLDFFIERFKVDIDSETSFNLTYRFSDLTNPSNITGDYSKTIRIKGTHTNNEIFGQIWNLDRKILFSDASNASISFNPAKRTKATIFLNNELFKSGYVKLNKVNIEKGVISYDITFYSDLCDVLKTLNDMKLADLQYPNNLRHRINRNNVKMFWDGTHTYSPYMTYVMTNSGLYDNFSNDKWLTKNNSTTEISDIMIGAEFDELAKREYRSYYQRPALTIKGLVNQIVSDYNAKDSSFNIILDNSFFNDDNPYYANSVLAFNRMNTDDILTNIIGTNDTSVMTVADSITENTTWTTDRFDYSGDDVFDGYTIKFSDIAKTSISTEFMIEVRGRIKNFDNLVSSGKASVGDIVTLRGAQLMSMNPVIELNDSTELEMTPYTDFDKFIDNLYCKVQYLNEDGDFIILTNTSKIGGTYNPGEQFVSKRPIRYYLDEYQFYSDGGIKFKFNLIPSMRVLVPYKSAYTYEYVEVLNWDIKVYPINKLPEGEPEYNASRYYPEGLFNGLDLTFNVNEKLQSDSYVDLTHILNESDLTVGDFLINYSKIFGLIWDIDKDNNVNIRTKNSYFADYRIIDWSDKIDYSKTIDISPISFDAAKLMLNYEDAETYYETHYKKKFDIDYGSQRILTGWEFDNNETNLISDIIFNNTVMSIENTKYVVGDDNNTIARWILDDKVLPALFEMEDGMRNQSDSQYNLLFYNGYMNIRNTIYISDDVADMFNDAIGGSDQPCWINPTYFTSDVIEMNQYPQFSTLYNNNTYSWNLGYPRENYAKWTNVSYPKNATIYNRYWQNYISEIYNANNKVMTCYVLLKPNDLKDFSFRDFIKIDNTLWHVNQISDYNPTTLTPTKVELMQVSNVEAIEAVYLNGQKI